MRPFAETNPRLAPWLGAGIAAALSFGFAFFERRPVVSALIEGVVLAAAIFLLVRSLAQPGRDR